MYCESDGSLHLDIVGISLTRSRGNINSSRIRRCYRRSKYVADLNLGGTSRSPLYLPLVLR